MYLLFLIATGICVLFGGFCEEGSLFFFSEDESSQQSKNTSNAPVQIQSEEEAFLYLPPEESSSTNTRGARSLLNTIQPFIELKGGYFFFSDATLRDVYSNGGYDFQISTGCPLVKWSKRYGLDLYASIEYLQCRGEAINSDQKTKIWQIPVSMGLRQIIVLFRAMQYYFTIGPRYFYVQQINDSNFVSKDISRHGLGFFVNTGLILFLSRHFFLDGFAEYSYEKVQFHTDKRHVHASKTQVGGFVFGAGLGYSF